MSVNTYTLIYLIANLFSCFLKYQYMHLFFDSSKNKKIELLSYLTFYAFIAAIYLNFSIPLLTLVSNIIGLYLLTLNYQASHKKRLLSVFLLYTVFICTDLIVAILTGYLNQSILETSHYRSEFGLVLQQIVNTIVLILLKNFGNMKKKTQVDSKNWLLLLFIPISSIYIILLLVTSQNLSNNQIIISLILMLFINFSTFYLYDNISQLFIVHIEKVNLANQNRYYANQLNLIEASVKNSDALKHDLKNHLLSISSLIENQRYELALNHISDITQGHLVQKKTINSGNRDIDSILNFKIQEAQDENIKVNSDIIIPEKIGLSTYDSTIILGNIFDNAINAVTQLDESKREINFKMHYTINRLLIFLENPRSSETNAHTPKKILFNQDQEQHHGLGLENIKQCIEKYNGTLEINKRPDNFTIKILMYL
ncbi:GHKL domain-containing protein [Eubacteriaceae bacterium ES2]|nr:GHKL domain-containing protein [Eubacteriaceae bacterium ES2]